MPVTAEQIKEALKDEGLKSQVLPEILPDAQKALEEKGMIIRTKEQDEQYLAARVEPLVETKIKDQIKAVHDKYDQDLLDLTGERKKPEEKTYDFLKRKIGEIKQEASKGEPVDKDRLKQLETFLENEKKSKATELAGIEKKYFDKEVRLSVQAAIAGFNIAAPGHLSEDDKKVFAENQKGMIQTDFLSKFTAKRDNDGNVVFYKGEELQVSTKDGKPLSAADLIAENYKTYFSAGGRKAAGGGTGAEPTQIGATSTKADVVKFLKAKGLQEGTKAFVDEYAKLVKENGIVK